MTRRDALAVAPALALTACAGNPAMRVAVAVAIRQAGGFWGIALGLAEVALSIVTLADPAAIPLVEAIEGLIVLGRKIAGSMTTLADASRLNAVSQTLLLNAAPHVRAAPAFAGAC